MVLVVVAVVVVYEQAGTFVEAITNSRMARAWRGTSRLLVVIVYGTRGVGGGGSCFGLGRHARRN